MSNDNLEDDMIVAIPRHKEILEAIAKEKEIEAQNSPKAKWNRQIERLKGLFKKKD